MLADNISVKWSMYETFDEQKKIIENFSRRDFLLVLIF